MNAITYRINHRPTPTELCDLHEAVGWRRPEDDYPDAFSGYSLTVSAHGDDGRLVGWTAVVSDNVRHAFLVDVMVRPDFQRHRIGTTLVGQAIAAMSERGVTLVHVDFAPKHMAFYKACGFKMGGGGWIESGASKPRYRTQRL